MWNTKCLVQVQVANVGTQKSRGRQSNLSVHVGSIHVHLSSSIMNEVNHVTDVLLKQTIRAWIRDHDTAQLGLVLLHELAQMCHVNVSILQAADNNHTKSSHDGRRRIGSVCRGWDQANVTLSLPNRRLVRANGTQTSILTLRTTVGLQRHCVEPSDGSQ
jgi:hypothetical protein